MAAKYHAATTYSHPPGLLQATANACCYSRSAHSALNPPFTGAASRAAPDLLLLGRPLRRPDFGAIMKLKILASAISITLPLSVFAGPGHPEHRQAIEEIIVSASPLQKNHSENTRPASVLSGDALRQQAAATLGETLKGQLGVSSASFGPGVGTPVIRGQQGNRVKVMQDNLDTLDAASASADHANATEALLAERIEVLRGPQTLRYGSGAIGGVINVIDNRIPNQVPSELGGAIEVRHNSVNQETASVFKLDGGSGQLAWHLDGLHRNSDNVDIPGFANPHGEEHPDETTYGFIDNTDASSKSLTGGFSWVGEDRFIGLSISRLENNYGIPAGAHGHEEEDEHHDEDEHDEDEHEGEEDHHEEVVRIDMVQNRYDLKGEWQNPSNTIDKALLRMGYVDYQHKELEGSEVGTVFSSQAFEGRLELVHRSFFNNQLNGAIGFQFSDKDFAAVGAEAFIPASQSNSYGIFIIEEWQQDNWSLEGGLRLERQSIDPQSNNISTDHNTHSISLAGQYRISEQQRLNLVVSRTQRAPSVEELYADGVHVATSSYERGNANLKAETSHNIELGYNYHMPLGESVLELDINVFYNDIADFIYRRNTDQTLEDAALFQYSAEDATFKGMEAQLTLPIANINGHQWDVQLFADAVRAELVDGQDVPRIPAKRIGAKLDYHGQWFNQPLDAQLRLVRAAKQSHPGFNEETTAGYTRLEAQLNYRIDLQASELLLFMRGNNLLDKDIRNASSFLREIAPEAGRSISVGARYSF